MSRLDQRWFAKTAAYTILPAADRSGTRFSNRGAAGSVTFTLPTPRAAFKGLWYEFEVHAAQTVIVSCATAGKIATIGNAAADNVSYAIAGSKVGARMLAKCDGTQWHCSGIGLGFCVNGTQVTPTAAEIANIIGLSLSAAELGYIDGITAIGTVQASKAVVVDANKDALGFRTVTTERLNYTPVARTATADGLTTGTIADAGMLQFVAVTCDDANKIIVLPTPTPGTMVWLNNGATGYELRSSSPTTIAINGGTGAAAESAIPANSTVLAICITATTWKAIFLDADSDVAKVEAAAT